MWFVRVWVWSRDCCVPTGCHAAPREEHHGEAGDHHLPQEAAGGAQGPQHEDAKPAQGKVCVVGVAWAWHGTCDVSQAACHSPQHPALITGPQLITISLPQTSQVLQQRDAAKLKTLEGKVSQLTTSNKQLEKE